MVYSKLDIHKISHLNADIIFVMITDKPGAFRNDLFFFTSTNTLEYEKQVWKKKKRKRHLTSEHIN